MRYLVHIGYPKAASTWLQKNLFSGRNPQFTPLGEGRDGAYRKAGGNLFHGLIDGTAYISPFEFDVAAARQKLDAGTDRNAAVTVLSNEAWCGQPFTGAFGKDLAERIHSVVPEATILVVVRSQPEMILSSYLHYLVKHRGTMTLDEFLQPVGWTRRPPFSPPYLQYIDLVAFYDQLFGRCNVVVLPFERIRESATAFLTPLCESLQVWPEDNLSSAVENARDLRQSMLLSRWPRLNLVGKISQRDSVLRTMELTMSEAGAQRRKQALIDRIRDELADFYRPGNRRLAERIGCDLASLDYPV